MKLLDKIIQTNLKIYQTQVDDVDYIVMGKEAFKELAQEYRDMIGSEAGIVDVSITEIEEYAGARILVPLSGKIYGDFQFCKRIRADH